MKRLMSVAMAATLALVATTVASAQTNAMVIEFTSPDSPPTARVVVFVGEIACAEGMFDSNSPPTALLGTADQPAGCGTEGAAVTFLQFRAYNDDPGAPIVPFELSERTTFAAGTTFQFLNWAPAPGADPAPPEGPLPAQMRAFVESGAAIQPVPGAPTQTGRALVLDFTQVSTLPEPRPERIVVFVGEIACTDVRFAEVSPPIILLGADGQPDGCGAGADGTEMSFLMFGASGNASELFERTFFAPYGSYTLTNWAPQPPGTALPVYMQAFIDTGTVVQPADNGNAGLERARTSPPGTLLVLATILLLAASRRLTAGRPH
jgi:hypothetical protein